MVHLAAAAVIPADSAARAAVSDVKLATAVTAAKEASEKRFTTAHRSTTHEALPVGVVGDQALIPLELDPRNIPLVVVLDQNVPVAAPASEAAHDPLATRFNRHTTSRAPKHVGTSVGGIGQDVVDRIVDGQLPFDATTLGTIADRRQSDSLLPQPEVNLPHRLHLGKFDEHECERVLDALIRVLLDPIVRYLEIADGNVEEELAP